MSLSPFTNVQAPTEPTAPQPGTPQPGTKPAPASPVNPDPKAHPIHAPIPVQPIHEGTDPKQPVHTDDEKTR